MSSIYSEPVNTADELYINYYGQSISFYDLSHSITAHFGDGVQLNQFDISVERIQVRGCSCCNDSSDYELYIVITRRKQPCTETSSAFVTTLEKEQNGH